MSAEGSKYLALAERMISARGIPLTGGQIIELANEFHLLPYQNYETVVKTLQARIAEDIAKHKTRSKFIRTGIGTYFLRNLVGKPTIFGQVRWLKDRAPREKPEHPHRILTVPRSAVHRLHRQLGWEKSARILEQGIYDYQSEIKQGHVPVVTAVALRWRDQLYSFDVGVHTHFENISGRSSILLRKFLDEFDLDLFETDGTGATSCSVRAAFPVIAEGRRARLEAGRLTSREKLHFYQVANLLSNRSTAFSVVTDCLLLVSTIDLSNLYDQPPRTHRRLELNQADWLCANRLEETLTDEDSQHALLYGE